jgi:hypothetical protein
MKATKSKKDPRKRCLEKFLYYFKKGFYDQKYLDWERNYKWNAHVLWEDQLDEKQFKKLIAKKEFKEIAKRAVNIESKTNLLFSFEKMALRDAVKETQGAEIFSKGLYDLIYGKATLEERFKNFTLVLDKLPRKQTRVVTWPLQTVFGFIARPDEQIFLKPRVTQSAAEEYAFDFYYKSRPNWETYESLLKFANQIRNDAPGLKPRDYIDLQSFIWVLGSSEYPL